MVKGFVEPQINFEVEENEREATAIIVGDGSTAFE